MLSSRTASSSDAGKLLEQVHIKIAVQGASENGMCRWKTE